MILEERKLNSIEKEIAKLTKSAERYANILAKKDAECKKLGCDWTREEMHEHEERGDMSNKQWSAYFGRVVARGNVEDVQRRLENAFKRVEKARSAFEAVAEKVAEKTEKAERLTERENAWLQSTEKREKEYQAWLEWFKAECLKDGITIKNADAHFIAGNTPKGNSFAMCINSGASIRSRHCYQLSINGVTYFTSGLFSTGYAYLMNN